MSKKTIFKRIALTAVSALAAGTLTVISVPAASADDNNAAGSASNATGAEGVLNIATIATTTGGATANGTLGSNSSAGLVNVSDIAGGRVAGTTQTAVLLATGGITVYTVTSGTTNDGQNIAAITVEGGSITSAANIDAINSTRTVAVSQGAASVAAVAVTPNAGATAMTIRMFNGQESTYGASASAALSTAVAAPSLGTLAGQITITIAATSAAGVMAASTSGVWYDDTGAGGQTADDAAGASSGWAKKTPGAQYANIRVRDAFGNGISSTAGLLQATATGGALVAINAKATTTAGTASTAFRTGAAPDDVTLVVSAPSFAPISTTVTVTYNGVEVGKKAFAFTGPITKVILGAPLRINALSATATAGDGVKGGTLAFADAADNVIYPVANDTYYPTSGLLVDAKSDRTPVMSVTPTSSATGHYNWNCGSAASTDAAIFDYVNINGAIATSNAATVSCAGNAVSYSASFDKASYTPGEVATLSVTFKDSKGNLANDTYDWSSGSFGSSSVSVGGGTLAVASSSSDTSALGVAKYRVLTGVTEGTYNAVVNVDALTAQAAVTASYTIKASSAAVSTNEVLAAIVKLIATINKQIRQLQKQLRR